MKHYKINGMSFNKYNDFSFKNYLNRFDGFCCQTKTNNIFFFKYNNLHNNKWRRHCKLLAFQ